MLVDDAPALALFSEDVGTARVCERIRVGAAHGCSRSVAYVPLNRSRVFGGAGLFASVMIWSPGMCSKCL